MISSGRGAKKNPFFGGPTRRVRAACADANRRAANALSVDIAERALSRRCFTAVASSKCPE